MRVSTWIILAITLFMAGCAAYKELQPEPPISFVEAGYIELQDDDEKFELSEGKKYFIKFPRPQTDNTYLVLTFSDKSEITSYLTRAFDDGEGAIIKMEDLSDQPKQLSLYQVDQSVPLYYWVIENVQRDLDLDMTYRYVAIWRYKFETKYAAYEETLKNNTQSRKLLEDIGKTIDLSSINYQAEKNALSQKLKNIENVNNQMDEIKAILPADILNSQDQAYKDYQALSKRIEGELQFQHAYLKTLDLLEIISSAQPDIDKFVTLAPAYTELMKDRSNYPAPFYEAVKKDLTRTLSAVTPYYENVLIKKNDIVPVAVNLKPLKEVYAAAGIAQDQNLGVLGAFIDLFNERSKTLASVKDELNAINKEITAGSGWPADNFYTEKRSRLSRLSQQLPPAGSDAFGKYKSYSCAVMLDNSVSQTKQEIWRLDQQFQRAGLLVGQINQLKRQGDFSGILSLLKQNRDLKFLMSQYAQVDELSLSQQKQAISSALAVNDFHRAENALRDLSLNTDYLNPDLILPRKEKLVRAYQDSLFRQVEGVSLARANEFIEANKTTVDQVDSLYMNKALYPAYTFTYNPTPGFAAQQNKVLADKMIYMRTQKFPSTAIDALYRALTDAMHVQGVEKARAIVIHGSNYQGDDSKLKNLIAECDPGASKWLTKVKQYRKILALPLTTNIGGSNQYMVKINIQIPSEAKFPVYDINIKLPQEVAKHAGSRQWYEKITFNGKLLKNEGRFTITSPDPNNDYIAQISPLQVNKTGNNVLEIRFSYDAFKVLEISVMGQKPIIKKN
jgi:hypothetical protein